MQTASRTRWGDSDDHRQRLSVGWSCGNPFYYAYGFGIVVTERA
jgi:hypothetical protein